MPLTLERLIESFASSLTALRSDFGSAWIVFHDDRALAGFPTFAEAADFAYRRLGEQQYLIRHTYQEPEFVPLLLVSR
jgi:hypothetical protein